MCVCVWVFNWASGRRMEVISRKLNLVVCLFLFVVEIEIEIHPPPLSFSRSLALNTR